MLKRSIAIFGLILLAGCQTAQHRDYVFSCPQVDIPLRCSIDYSKSGCGNANQAVESCSRFIDRNVRAEEARQAQSKGAVAGAECNTVIELKLEHHAA